MSDVSISIATHNRCEDLLRTCAELARLDPAPCEIIICADGCTDATLDEIRRQYPQVTLIENASPLGSVASRDRILRIAKGEIVLSLDDDSYPVEIDFLARLEERFADDPTLAVVSCFQITDEFPETIDDPESQRGERRLVASFPNSAAAIRREVYIRSAGYPVAFFHAYEEPDFAVQCYALGYNVLYEPQLTIRHHFTPAGRNETRTHHRHARNEFWSTAMRAPWLVLPAVAIYRVASQFRYALRRGVGWAVREPLWWIAALRGLPRCLRDRQTVPLADYMRWLKLFRRPSPYHLPSEPQA